MAEWEGTHTHTRRREDRRGVISEESMDKITGHKNLWRCHSCWLSLVMLFSFLYSQRYQKMRHIYRYTVCSFIVFFGQNMWNSYSHSHCFLLFFSYIWYNLILNNSFEMKEYKLKKQYYWRGETKTDILSVKG